MKKLLKEYNLTSNAEYYEIVQESFINGQLKQAREQFKAMPRENQKDMVKAIDLGGMRDGAVLHDFFFDLL